MSEAPPFEVRRVVAGTREDGSVGVLSDGRPGGTVAAESGFAVSELLWFEAPPAVTSAGDDPPRERLGKFPTGGAIAARLIRFPANAAAADADAAWVRVESEDPAQPGMHRSETLDLMVVLSGRVVLGLDEGEHEIGPGDAVIQRGTRHRWRVAGGEPCTFLSVLISPMAAPGASMQSLTPCSSHPRDAGFGRFITTTAGGSSTLFAAGPPTELRTEQVVIRDWWQTGGVVTATDQGGDAPSWSLEPEGAGISLRTVDFTGGHDPGPAGLHATNTIDIDLVLSGSLALDLPSGGADSPETTTALKAGDVVVMRGVTHRWRPLNSAPASMASVMFGLVP